MVPEIRLTAFTPAALPALIDFLNHVLAGHRHWAPITARDFALRVLDQPGFDPKGLLLAWHGERVVGGVHAIKPQAYGSAFRNVEPQHHIAWLVVHPEMRGQAVGQHLLTAAENYLYYCPVYFAESAANLLTNSAYDPVANDFTTVRLADHKKAGKWTLLFFYPADFTFV